MSHLVENGCDRPGPLPAAREGDDAVAAHVVATTLDGPENAEWRLRIAIFIDKNKFEEA